MFVYTYKHTASYIILQYLSSQIFLSSITHTEHMLLCFSLHLDVHNHYFPYTSKLPCPSPHSTYTRPFQLYQLQFYSNVMIAQLVNDIYIEQAMHQIVFPPPRKRSEEEQKIYAAALE